MRTRLAAVWLVFGTLSLAAGPEPAPAPASAPTPAATPATLSEVAHLPRWLQMGIELRGRFENPFGPRTPANPDDYYYLHRLRFQTKVQLPAGFKLSLELQDSETIGYDRRPLPPSLVDTLDLRQAYVEYTPPEHQRWRLRAGRQALIYGETRLIGSSNWGNVGPAWDAVNVAYSRPGMKIEAFAASPVTPMAREFDRPHTWTGLHGVYAVFDKLVKEGTIDAYGFWKRQGADYCHLPGGVSFWTSGFRAVGKLPHAFDYNTETAFQFGSAGTDRVRAWAGHYAFGYATGPSRPKLFVQYDYASGDGDGTDGRRGTFDQLYATYKWGTADGFGWRNIVDPAVGAEWNAKQPFKLRAAYHFFWLADRRDGLYSQTNGIYVKGFNAGSARVGDEVEIRGEYRFGRHFRLTAGTARMFPGPYLKEAGYGRAYQTLFLMWNYAL